MKLTVLLENTVSDPALVCEHGLSVHIAGLRGKNYLVDTGATDAFAKNATALGVDLNLLSAAIITHNHFDHIGGLGRLLEHNPSVPVYLRREAQNEFFAVTDGQAETISRGGLFGPYARRFAWVDGELEIDDGVWLLSADCCDTAFANRDTALCKRENGVLVPDDFAHELYISIIIQDKMVLLTGCSHRGIVNIVRSAKQRFPAIGVKAVVGGFHMKGRAGIDSMCCAPDFVRATAAALLELDVERIYTCHCTGNPAYAILERELAGRVEYIRTGSIFAIN